jgi:hypothetical protein
MAARIDAEFDLHGYTGAAAKDQLEIVWSRGKWHGFRRVRIIHGTGEVLYKVVRRWADEKSIPWTLEPYNPGVTILQPSLRRGQNAPSQNRPFARHQNALRAFSDRRAAQPEEVKAREVKGDSPGKSPPESQDPQSANLFKEEMARLDQQDPRSMHKRKHGA